MSSQKSPSLSDRVFQLRIFAQVADRGSFVGAARALKIPPATVSAAIRMLEGAVGIRVLHRTTRQVGLTHEGRQILPMARKIALDLQEIYQLFEKDEQLVAGRLKVDVPSRIASRMIAPALPSFLRRYPDLQLEIGSSGKYPDVSAHDVDCLIRVGVAHDESLICKPLGMLDMVNCASPAYLASHNMPERWDELVDHWAVGYAVSAGKHPAAWNCTDQSGAPRTVVLRHRFVVDNMDSYLACCQAGVGLIQVPRFDVQHLLASGELVEVLRNSPAAPLPIVAFYLHRHQRSRRLAAFIDWFHELLRPVVQ